MSATRTTWRSCQQHGDEKPNVYGCAPCVMELREENRMLRRMLARALVELAIATGEMEFLNAFIDYHSGEIEKLIKDGDDPIL